MSLVLLTCGIAALALAGYAVTIAISAAARRAFPPKGRFVPVEGGRLHVLELGPPPERAGDGRPAIVLLHGASANARELATTLGAALCERYRVISVDRPGHGWSDRPGGRRDASPARQSRLIRQALDGMGVRSAVLVAHSLGGAVAARMALDDPQRVAGLVLLGAVTHEWPGGVTWYYTPAASRAVGWLFNRVIAAPVGALLLDAAVEGVFAPDPAPADYAERSGVRLVLRPSEFLANAQDVKDLIHGVREQQHRYGEIKAPTVVVHGLADNTVSPDLHARAIARQIAGSRLHLLPDVGHMPHHVAGGLVVAEIDALVQGLSASGPAREERRA